MTRKRERRDDLTFFSPATSDGIFSSCLDLLCMSWAASTMLDLLDIRLCEEEEVVVEEEGEELDFLQIGLQIRTEIFLTKE